MAYVLDPAYNSVYFSNNEQVLGTKYIDLKSIDNMPQQFCRYYGTTCRI